MWLRLLLLLWLLFAVARAQSSHGSKDSVSVLLVTLPYAGHLMPMAALGEELVRRGHAVTLCTVVANDSELQVNIANRAGIKIMIVENNILSSEYLFKLENEASNSTVFKNLLLDGMLNDVVHPLKGLILPYTKMLDKLNISLFDIAVVDMYFSPILTCISKKWKTKMVTLSADLSFYASLLPPPPPVPIIGTGVRPSLTMIQRYITAIISPMLEVVLHSSHDTSLSDLQCISNFHEPYGHNHPHLITSVIGFEFPQPTSPLVEYVGPLLSKNPEPLSTKLSRWLSSKSDLSVVYINLDSVIYLTADQTQNILKGALATNSTVVWSLNKKRRDIFEGVNVNPEKVFLSYWTPSLSLFKDRAIGVSILHGELGGLQDALSGGLPVIIVPFTDDHRDNAARIVNYQLGTSISPLELSSEGVADAISLVKSDSYQNNMAKLQRIYRWAGGVERAAFLIELFQEAGYNHLVPAYAKYNWSWIEYHNIDVYVFLVVMVMVTSFCISKCCVWLWSCLVHYCTDSAKQKSD